MKQSIFKTGGQMAVANKSLPTNHLLQLAKQMRFEEILRLAEMNPVIVFNMLGAVDEDKNNIFHLIAKQHSEPVQFTAQLFDKLVNFYEINPKVTDRWLTASNQAEETFYSLTKMSPWAEQLRGTGETGKYSARIGYFNKTLIGTAPKATGNNTTHAIS
jgi:hypothetical protein